MKTGLLTALLMSLSGGLLLADKDTDERLANAAKAFNEIMASDKGIPGQVLSQADCVVIVPGMKKAGFIVGGSYGRGAASCRTKSKTGWDAPTMVELGGGSFGLQLGADSTDVVMLLMDQSAVDNLVKGKFTLGGDVSVAAGPVGGTAAVDADKAKVLTYQRSKGAFVGVAMDGSSLSPDEGANKAVYGKQMTAGEILTGKVAWPASAKPLDAALNKYSPKGT
jgi:SH3 domain-containing YSC84-like protein 1